jgi:hypothetical protein
MTPPGRDETRCTVGLLHTSRSGVVVLFVIRLSPFVCERRKTGIVQTWSSVTLIVNVALPN